MFISKGNSLSSNVSGPSISTNRWGWKSYLFKKQWLILFLSLPELKAQISFSDHLSVRLHVSIFNFIHMYLEPL